MTVLEPVADILERLRDLPAEAILADTAGRYAGRVALATSLGIDDQVVTHMLAEAALDIPIFTIDTGRLFPETHDLIERTGERYGVSIAVYCPDAAEVEQMVARNGVNLFRHSAFKRELCCETRKVRPLRRAQVGLDVWICARHGGGAGEHEALEPVAWDASAGLVTVNPLAAWDAAAVWDYARAHDVPFSPLHAQGFATIDCAPCSSPAREG